MKGSPFDFVNSQQVNEVLKALNYQQELKVLKALNDLNSVNMKDGVEGFQDNDAVINKHSIMH